MELNEFRLSLIKFRILSYMNFTSWLFLDWRFYVHNFINLYWY